MSDGVWVSFGHDGNQNLTSVTYADGSGIDYIYADPLDPHNLTRKQNKIGHLIAGWSYDSQDRAVSSSLPDDTGVTLDYTTGGQVEVTDAYGVLRTYTLDQIGRRGKVVAMDGPPVAPYSALGAIRWQYDDQLNLEEVEYAGGTSGTPRNTVHRFENFDARGNPQTVIQAHNSFEERIIVYSYHPTLNTVLWRSRASVLDDGRFSAAPARPTWTTDTMRPA